MSVNLAKIRPGVWCFKGASDLQRKMFKAGVIIILAGFILNEFMPLQSFAVYATFGTGATIILGFLISYNISRLKYNKKFSELYRAAAEHDAAALARISPDWPNAMHWHGHSLVSMFIVSENLETLGFLLENGANPNVIDRHGMTPLHYAVTSQNQGYAYSVSEMLLARGANMHQCCTSRSYYGTPYEIALSAGRVTIVNLLNFRLTSSYSECLAQKPELLKRARGKFSQEHVALLNDYELGAGAWRIHDEEVTQFSLSDINFLPRRLRVFFETDGNIPRGEIVAAVCNVQYMMSSDYRDPYGVRPGKEWCATALNRICGILQYLERAPLEEQELQKPNFVEVLGACVGGNSGGLELLYCQTVRKDWRAKDVGRPGAILSRRAQDLRLEEKNKAIVIHAHRTSKGTIDTQSRHTQVRITRLFNRSLFKLPPDPLASIDKTYYAFGQKDKDQLIFESFCAGYNKFSLVYYLWAGDKSFDERNGWAQELYGKWIQTKYPSDTRVWDADGFPKFDFFPEFLVDMGILKQRR